MHVATLSSKYQLSIPKAVRENLSLKAGQRFAVIAKGKLIELVPVPTLADMRGVLKGKNVEGYRDRQDRV
jgi:AbrB family looped-hinge helix DNA binding protein